MQKWEYKSVVVAFDENWLGVKDFKPELLDEPLSLLGAEGWELVSTNIPTKNGYSTQLIAVLKRPR